MRSVRRSFVVSSFGLLVGAGLFAGCGDESEGGGGGNAGSVKYSVPAGGGSVEVKTKSGNVLSFEFPASAGGKTVTLTPTDGASIGWPGAFEDAIRMEPDGTQFAEPVRVKPSKKNLLLLTFPNQSTKSPGEGLPLASSGDALELSHFSTLVVLPPGGSCGAANGWEVINDAAQCQAFAPKTSYVSFGCNDPAYCVLVSAHCCAAPGSTECQLGDADLFVQYKTGTGPAYCGPGDAGTDSSPSCSIDTGGNLCASCAVTQQKCCAELSACYSDTQCNPAFWQWASCNTAGGGGACFQGLSTSSGAGVAIANCLESSGCAACTALGDAGTDGSAGTGGAAGAGGSGGTGGAASGGTGGAATGGTGGSAGTGGAATGGTGAFSGSGGAGGTGAFAGTGGAATGGTGGAATGGTGGAATGGTGGAATGGTGGGAGSATLLASAIEAQSLAIDATSAFLTTGMSEVLKVPLVGGAPVALSTGEFGAGAVVVDASNVYWATTTSVRSIPKAGGTATTLATSLNTVADIALASGTIYIAEAGGGRILSVPATGGSLTTLVSTQSYPSSVATNGTLVFFGNHQQSGKQNPNSVLSVPVSGGTPTVLGAASSPMDILLLGSTVYYVNGGKVSSVPTGGGTVTDLTSAVTARSLGADASNVYFAANSTVGRFPIGGGSVTTLASGLTNAWGVAVDGTYVYFIQQGVGGGVYRQTK